MKTAIEISATTLLLLAWIIFWSWQAAKISPPDDDGGGNAFWRELGPPPTDLFDPQPTDDRELTLAA